MSSRVPGALRKTAGLGGDCSIRVPRLHPMHGKREIWGISRTLSCPYTTTPQCFFESRDKRRSNRVPSLSSKWYDMHQIQGVDTAYSISWRGSTPLWQGMGNTSSEAEMSLLVAEHSLCTTILLTIGDHRHRQSAYPYTRHCRAS